MYWLIIYEYTSYCCTPSINNTIYQGDNAIDWFISAKAKADEDDRIVLINAIGIEEYQFLRLIDEGYKPT